MNGVTHDGRRPRQVFLLPGTLHVAAEPTLVTTVLGSCIAVCLWDHSHRQGGMNHFVLPADTGREGHARYGDVAIDRLIDGMAALGSQLGDLRAKLFGGAAVLPTLSAPGSRSATVGARNLRMAQARLAQYRIPVVAQRTGGASGLVIRLDTGSGEVTLRTVTSRTAAGGGYPHQPINGVLRAAEGD